MTTAVVILGHGSKSPKALETLQMYCEMVKGASSYEIVEVASLQFNKPDLSETLDCVIEQGADRVIIMPLFLYNGIHMQQDIPQLIAEEKVKNPNVEIVVTSNLGADNRIVEIVLDRIRGVS